MFKVLTSDKFQWLII